MTAVPQCTIAADGAFRANSRVFICVWYYAPPAAYPGGGGARRMVPQALNKLVGAGAARGPATGARHQAPARVLREGRGLMFLTNRHVLF